mgnify:CR=1 FL=1
MDLIGQQAFRHEDRRRLAEGGAVEAVLVDLIDEIPGVPRIVAKIAAACAMKIIDAAIAGAGEGVKARN